MKILALGDVVGKAGRTAVKQHVPRLRKELDLDFVFANGENMAGGTGMTPDTLDELLGAGVDAVTGGNHSWKHREVYNRLDKDNRILRPANFPDTPEKTPGRGHSVFTLKDGRSLALLNIQGTTFMEALPCPFQTALAWVDELDKKNQAWELDDPRNIRVRLVDFHAEATSEKKVMGFALDGRVSAMLGTHTHVQCADAQILPHGTAYLTDLGMCGVEASALGVEPALVLRHFLTRRPVPFKPAKGAHAINGAFLDIDDHTGLAHEIRLIRIDTPPQTRK